VAWTLCIELILALAHELTIHGLILVFGSMIRFEGLDLGGVYQPLQSLACRVTGSFDPTFRHGKVAI